MQIMIGLLRRASALALATAAVGAIGTASAAQVVLPASEARAVSVAATTGVCPVKRTVISGATVFAGDPLVARPNSSVVIANGTIEQILPHVPQQPSSCTTIVNAEGQFLIPGLWDLHVHVSKTGSAFLSKLPLLGITAVRDMGSSLEEVNELRRRAHADQRFLPQISTPGPMFESEDVLKSLPDQKTLEPLMMTRQAVPEGSALINRITALRSGGANFIKIRSASSADEFRRVAMAANSLGLGVVTHPPPGLAPSELKGLGIISIEHASYPYPIVDGEKSATEVAHTFRELGIAIVPTLAAWRSQIASLNDLRDRYSKRLSDPHLLKYIPARLAVEWAHDLSRKKPRSEQGQKAWQGFYDQLVTDLRALYREGVQLGAGSDTGVETIVPGQALLEEICLLEREIGVRPIDLMGANTVKAAKLARMSDVTGSIEPGKSADMILLGKDPSVSLTESLRSLRMTFVRGHMVQHPDREVLLRQPCAA